MVLSNDYYMEQLTEQIDLLIDACHMYDKGTFAQAKVMSAIIRTLVKDSGKNKQTVSLLSSLDIKNNMKFYNTAYSAQDPAILLNFVGLVKQPDENSTNNFKPIYIPMFDNTGLIDVEWIEFGDWWESNVIVCKDHTNNFTLSRKQIILTMAEQGGGVHVDRFEKMNSVYRDIITHTSNILTHIMPDGKNIPVEYLMYAIVRQIAHEVIVTIKKKYDIFKSYCPTQDYILKGVTRDKIINPFMIALNDGDLSTRTSNPMCGGRTGPGIKVPEGTAFFRLEFHGR